MHVCVYICLAYLTLGSGSHLMNIHTLEHRIHNNRSTRSTERTGKSKKKERGLRHQFSEALYDIRIHSTWDETKNVSPSSPLFFLFLRRTQSIDCLSLLPFPSSSLEEREKRGHFHTQESLHYRLLRLVSLSRLAMHWVPRDIRKRSSLVLFSPSSPSPPLMMPFMVQQQKTRKHRSLPPSLFSVLWNTRTVQEQHRGNGNGSRETRTDNTGYSKMPS